MESSEDLDALDDGKFSFLHEKRRIRFFSGVESSGMEHARRN